jgi:hypothetical protein
VHQIISPLGAGPGAETRTVAGIAAVHDRKWWRIEARRVGSDWDSILALHATVIASWRAKHDPDYGSAS